MLGIAGLERVEEGVLVGMKEQVKRDLVRWHEDKRRGRRGLGGEEDEEGWGVEEEGWARGVYAGVFAVKGAVEGEVERRRKEGGRGW